jgi:hypothetical protein
MPESETVREGGDEDGGHDLAITSVERTDEEMREAYKVDWREPANKQTLVDRIRELL